MKKASMERPLEDPVGHENDLLPTFNADVSIRCRQSDASERASLDIQA
jgi:hypothetical protein